MCHALMLLCSILRLTGITTVSAKYETTGKPPVELEDIKNFRQFDSRCPGHPQYRCGSD